MLHALDVSAFLCGNHSFFMCAFWSAFAHGVRRAQTGGGTARRMPREKRSIASFLNRALHGSSRRPVRAASLRAKEQKARIEKTGRLESALSLPKRIGIATKKSSTGAFFCGIGRLYGFYYNHRTQDLPAHIAAARTFFLCSEQGSGIKGQGTGNRDQGSGIRNFPFIPNSKFQIPHSTLFAIRLSELRISSAPLPIPVWPA